MRERLRLWLTDTEHASKVLVGWTSAAMLVVTVVVATAVLVLR